MHPVLKSILATILTIGLLAGTILFIINYPIKFLLLMAGILGALFVYLTYTIWADIFDDEC